jgi:hypothetical protein
MFKAHGRQIGLSETNFSNFRSMPFQISYQQINLLEFGLSREPFAFKEKNEKTCLNSISRTPLKMVRNKVGVNYVVNLHREKWRKTFYDYKIEFR